ncbi:vacuolar assembly protein-like protein [Sporormia fimetaria CBS 119925]|uniref:Vacuolar assembly protein-like protein n=1 Tax=Sporormia fimetaria CBS 119925 TaxID=1340428 RepID=A0A6A6VNQ8_9PLEO|nr:vacuolar assembly protein-like protein [Sporormia fimetaria CBS 119925]
MAAEAKDDDAATVAREEAQRRRSANGKESIAREEEEEDDDSDQDDADEEPKLKYSRLTSSLAPVYRNGDATSTFMVAGDKMIVGTHNGNIHVVTVPTFQPLRTYNAHPSASVTALSVSPFPLTPSFFQSESPTRNPEPGGTPTRQSTASSAASARTPRQQPPVPAIPSNQIYIASASIDGHVCVSSLVDPKDVSLRNFARPVQAVALSPEYKSDRTYLSGGLAGDLILTTGAQAGVRSNANTSHAAATAQGWLGAIGLGSHNGKDTVLHSGEGIISTIKWSLSGKFVAWVNEHGIRIMRTDLHLHSADSESAWKRIGFIERPNRRVWEEMAGVWKARVEWINDEWLESDDEINTLNSINSAEKTDSTLPHLRGDTPHSDRTEDKKPKKKRKVEKLVIGWGDAAWVVHVHPGKKGGTGKGGGERSAGSVEIIHFLRFDDCIVSGISLYTPSLLIVLAYRTRDDDDNPITPIDTTPRRGMHRRHNGLSPELKLIDAATSDEVEVDSLTVSRYETLSAADYHLSSLYVPHPKTMTPAQRNALEAIGGGIWDAGLTAARIFSSGASIISMPSSSDVKSPSSSVAGGASAPAPKRQLQPHPNAATVGLKIFIQSPYDCVMAVKRDLADHFNWELEHENYKDAWELIEDHPEIVATAVQSPPDASPTHTPAIKQGSLHEFFADDSESQTTISAARANQTAAIEKEKNRIGDLWVQQLVNAGNWEEAGKVAGRVLSTSSRWEHWVWTFAQANRFNEIAPYIPTKPMKPPLPSMVYEVVLGHYIFRDRVRFKNLLEEWDPELFNIDSVLETIKSKLEAGDVTEDTVEDGEPGRDWRILQDALAKLYLAGGHQREALRCYILLQNADAAMALIRDSHLVEAIRDDIPGFILLRISKEQLDSAALSELEEASEEAINVLVDEGCRGIVPAEDVVHQLQEKGDLFQPFLFFYLRALWKPRPHERTDKTPHERIAADRLAADGQRIAEIFADLIVEMFAEYDRDLLDEFLRKSQSYDLGKAAAICERRNYIRELVHILSKTGQTKRALYLIIEDLSDVSFAISFAKEQDDPDLWNDLLEYSMDKPHFIRGLLEEVGTAIDPIQLVKRIPEGLEIEGLRDGIGRMVREYEIQHSISEGVARVLRGEVAKGMDTLRAGQKRGVKFEVVPCDDEDSNSVKSKIHGSHKEKEKDNTPKGKEVDVKSKGVDPPTAAAVHSKDKHDTAIPTPARANLLPDSSLPARKPDAPPGHCTFCTKPFVLPTSEDELLDSDDTDFDPNTPISPSRDTLVGFACGHVFHLSCLLPKTSVSPEVASLLLKQLKGDVGEGGGWGRSVGAKVAHAHLIRRAVGGGCVACKAGVEVEE